MPQQTNRQPESKTSGLERFQNGEQIESAAKGSKQTHSRPINACPVIRRDARRASGFISAFPFGLVAPVTEDVQQVFGLAWRTADPGIKHRMDYQAVRAFGRRFGRAQGGQGEFLVLRPFEGAGLHGFRRWDARCDRPRKRY